LIHTLDFWSRGTMLAEDEMSCCVLISCNVYFLVLVAEVVKHFYPQLVEIHNYASAHAISKKTVNWHILNR